MLLKTFIVIVTIYSSRYCCSHEVLQHTSSSDSISYGLKEVNEEAEGEKQTIFLRCIINMLKEQLHISEINTSGCTTRSYDKVTIYAREVLSMGMLHAQFRDAVKEGDGPRVIWVRKFLLPTFRAANRIKVCIHSSCKVYLHILTTSTTTNNMVPAKMWCSRREQGNRFTYGASQPHNQTRTWFPRIKFAIMESWKNKWCPHGSYQPV